LPGGSEGARMVANSAEKVRQLGFATREKAGVQTVF
jgi:hypothetical protein